MIGQKELKTKIDILVGSGKFPKFFCIVGEKGSGKTLIAKYIAEKLSNNICIVGSKVDEVREVIETAMTVAFPTLYCFDKADDMRQEAKNALLKITEEPPQNAWFCMVVEDESSLLETIKSRAYIFYMDVYSRQEKLEYASKYEESMLYADICETPGQIDEVNGYGLNEFLDYVNLVIDNIAEVQSANAFKTAQKVALKQESDGYDMKMFWKACVQVMLDRLVVTYDTEWRKLYCRWVICTTESISQIKPGINKQQLFDMWVFDIRKEYYDGFNET